MDATTPAAERRDGPELYTGLAFEMEEIALGMNVLQRHARDLRGSFDAKQTVSLAVQAAELSKVAGQISTLAAHMSKIAGKHINRNTRT